MRNVKAKSILAVTDDRLNPGAQANFIQIHSRPNDENTTYLISMSKTMSYCFSFPIIYVAEKLNFKDNFHVARIQRPQHGSISRCFSILF